MKEQHHKWKSVFRRTLKDRTGYNFRLVICANCDALGRKFDNGNVAVEFDYFLLPGCKAVLRVKAKGAKR